MNKTWISGLVFPVIFFFLLKPAHAQICTVKGNVVDAVSLSPVKGVSVIYGRKGFSAADSLGHFRFTIEYGRHTLYFSCLGYRTLTRMVNITTAELDLQLELEPLINILDQVVVSASRYEKKLSQEVISLNIINPDFLTRTNSTDLSDAVNRLSGVNIVDGQPTIRAGMGYSYNTGSRVMVMLDGMSMLGPDIGDVKWKFMPIEAADQIEVVKGTNSVLYGTAALNGSINVITGWPGKKPETKVSSFNTIYDNPKNKAWVWWKTGSQPNQSGAFITHKQQFGRFDLVWSGHVFANDNYLQQGDEHRIRTFVKTRYRSKKKPGLSFGINGNVMYEKVGSFYAWQDGDSGAYKPIGGSADQFPYRLVSIDPHFTYAKKNGMVHTIKMRYYNITRYPDRIRYPLLDLNRYPGGKGARANTAAVDYSFKFVPFKHFVSTSGTYITTNWAQNNNYPGKYRGYSGAIYTQMEYMKGRWSTLLGSRYELNALAGVQHMPRPLLRSGLNFRAAPRTHLRASYGEGYRFPTIAERYVEDNAADIRIVPNPFLKSEYGWSAEVGAKQGFRISNFYGELDYAVYWMEYRNMIEYSFGQHNLPTDFTIGLKPKNIGKARTAGMELSLNGEGKIGPVLVNVMGGYTASYPVNLVTASNDDKKVGNYAQGYFDHFPKADSAFAQQTLLPYRSRKLLKWDTELTWKRISVGHTIYFYSVYEHIEPALLITVPGLYDFIQHSGNGDWVNNLRFGYRLGQQLTCAFMVNNISNTVYATRPAKLDPPRSFTLQMRYAIR